METQQKIAWLPKIVETWRNTQAIIWMQTYYVKGKDTYSSLGGDERIGYKYCLKLGMFSIEL